MLFFQARDCLRRYRKHKKDTADLEDKYKRDDYGRRYACVGPYLSLRLFSVLTVIQLRYKPPRPLRRPSARMGHLRAVCRRHCPRHGRGAKFGASFHSPRILTAVHQVAAEHKKSEALVTRIISAAVQRARNLDSMNQSLAEQLQRARSDIAQVDLPPHLLPFLF